MKIALIRRPYSRRARVSTFWRRNDWSLAINMGLMALSGRRPAEIFFSASFSLPKKKLSYPALLFDGQLKTRQTPGTSFEPYPIPVLADSRKLIQALDSLPRLVRAA
jgi:Telomere resolvase